MPFQPDIHTGDDLAAAIDADLTYATCSSISIQGRHFGYDASRSGRSYTVQSFDTMSGIPPRFLGSRGMLTGRYIVPAGCRRVAARWEVVVDFRSYLWISLEEG